MLSEVKELEKQRDAVAIDNEEQVTNYYRIRQQLHRLEREMQVGREGRRGKEDKRKKVGGGGGSRERRERKGERMEAFCVPYRIIFVSSCAIFILYLILPLAYILSYT